MTDNTELLSARSKAEELLILGGTNPIVGVGARASEDTVTVYLTEITEDNVQKVYSKLGASKVNGHELQFISSGNVKALCSCVNNSNAFSNTQPMSLSVGNARQLAAGETLRTTYHRPIKGGDSIGHFATTAGTLGAVVYDRTTKQRLILSNNHVLSNSTSYSEPTANVGDEIYAPGCYDSPTKSCTPDYRVGTLHRFIPFNKNELNYVDAAVAVANNDKEISDEIVGIGRLNGYKSAMENQRVRKSGRTTGITEGEVIDVHATLEVDFYGNIFKFSNSIVTGYMAAGGDSGSILVDKDTNDAVGLLFGGSDTITVYNRIENVMSSLGVLMTPNDKVTEPQMSLSLDKVFYDNVVPFAISAAGISVFVAVIPVLEQQAYLILRR